MTEPSRQITVAVHCELDMDIPEWYLEQVLGNERLREGYGVQSAEDVATMLAMCGVLNGKFATAGPKRLLPLLPHQLGPWRRWKELQR